MTSKVTVASKFFTAVVAVIGFDVCVGKQVGFQVAPLVKGSAAGGALVWRLLKVQGLMDCEGSSLTESFTTLRTFKWFFFRMDIFVVTEMILSPEGLVTDVTAVWTLIGMGPFVDEEVIRFREVTTTETANKFFLSAGWSSPLFPFWRLGGEG